MYENLNVLNFILTGKRCFSSAVQLVGIGPPFPSVLAFALLYDVQFSCFTVLVYLSKLA